MHVRSRFRVLDLSPLAILEAHEPNVHSIVPGAADLVRCGTSEAMTDIGNQEPDPNHGASILAQGISIKTFQQMLHPAREFSPIVRTADVVLESHESCVTYESLFTFIYVVTNVETRDIPNITQIVSHCILCYNAIVLAVDLVKLVPLIHKCKEGLELRE